MPITILAIFLCVCFGVALLWRLERISTDIEQVRRDMNHVRWLNSQDNQ